MLSILTFASVVVAAFGWGGWDPTYCCYPVPEVCCPVPPCPDCLDVAFVVDISSSVGPVRLSNYINPFLDMFATSPDWVIGTGAGQVQASVVTFATDVTLRWNWGSAETANSASLSAAIAGVSSTQFEGLTNTPEALKVTREQVLEGPGNRPDCSDVCIVITDGKTTIGPELLANEAAEFNMACDVTVVVGVTPEVVPEELDIIAPDNVLMIDDFDQLGGIFYDVFEMIECPNEGNGGGNGGNGLPYAYASGYDCCPYDYPYYYDIMHKEKW